MGAATSLNPPSPSDNPTSGQWQRRLTWYAAFSYTYLYLSWYQLVDHIICYFKHFIPSLEHGLLIILRVEDCEWQGNVCFDWRFVTMASHTLRVSTFWFDYRRDFLNWSPQSLRTLLTHRQFHMSVRGYISQEWGEARQHSQDGLFLVHAGQLLTPAWLTARRLSSLFRPRCAPSYWPIRDEVSTFAAIATLLHDCQHCQFCSIANPIFTLAGVTTIYIVCASVIV